VESNLIRAFEVAVLFDRPTTTIIGWAKQGLLPGAIFVGSRVWFRRQDIEGFLARGGTPQKQAHGGQSRCER
jgi:hypothetical protein